MPKKNHSKRGADVWVRRDGTILLFWPLTRRARVWLDHHVDEDQAQYVGKSIVVEHRYAGELARGMAAAGLRLV